LVVSCGLLASTTFSSVRAGERCFRITDAIQRRVWTAEVLLKAIEG
jgi:hypothetical protein